MLRSGLGGLDKWGDRMSSRNVSRSGVSVLFQWILLNAVGWAIGSTLRRLAFGIVGATVGFAAGRVVEGAVIGVAVGIAQSLILPRSISRGLWVLASTIAWALAWFVGWNLGWSVFGGMGLRMVFVVIGAMAGLLAGTLQWLLLRQHTPRAGWWVLASTVGWAVGLGLAVSVGRALGWMVAGAVGGAFTGPLLIWLFRRPTSVQRTLGSDAYHTPGSRRERHQKSATHLAGAVRLTLLSNPNPSLIDHPHLTQLFQLGFEHLGIPHHHDDRVFGIDVSGGSRLGFFGADVSQALQMGI